VTFGVQGRKDGVTTASKPLSGARSPTA
jgi:hypothetical protein